MQHLYDRSESDGYSSDELAPEFTEIDNGWQEESLFKKESKGNLIKLANSRVKLSQLFDLYKIRFDVVYSPSGWTHKTRCPLPNHRDSDPSFGYNPEEDFYNCFGCGAKGKAVNFKAAIDKISLRDAAETLIELYNIGYDTLEIEKLQSKDDNIDNLLLEFSNFIRKCGKDYTYIEKVLWNLDVYIQKNILTNSLSEEKLLARINILKEKL